MTAGYLLSVMVGTPKAISAERLFTALCEKLAPSISAKYQDSEDGQHTAGTVLLTILILIAVIPSLAVLLVLNCNSYNQEVINYGFSKSWERQSVLYSPTRREADTRSRCSETEESGEGQVPYADPKHHAGYADAASYRRDSYHQRQG